MKKIALIVGVVIVVTILAILALRKPKNTGHFMAGANGGAAGSASPQKAGNELANGNCNGTGPGVLSQPAMKPSDFAYIIPYGLMVGGHVTPIDHQYYAPADFQSARDAYPVYAMGDAILVDIEHRTQSPGDNKHVIENKTDEYRLVFSQTCTFLYYYDLLTSLTPEIKTVFDSASRNGFSAAVNIPVKAGQQVGAIGGQTLDFAVWNTQKPLSGFVVPQHYEGERWKIYVADPLDYYTPELKQLMLGRYPRVNEPLSGKIDWDIDGKLRGTWFAKGTNFLNDNGGSPTPWAGHLSFAPDLYDPSRFIISIGNYGEVGNTGVAAQQFYAKGNPPAGGADPAAVGPDSGLIKYELVQSEYLTPAGAPWDRHSFVKGLKVKEDSQVFGTALAQMTGGRELKFESFPGKTAAEVAGFDDKAKIYTR